MSTTPGTRQRRQHVTPSLVKSETFLFALLVFGLAIYVPYMLKTGKGSSIRYVNTTVPIGGAPDAFTAIPSPVIVPPTPVVVPPLANVPVAAQQPAAVPTERRPAPITYIFPYLFSFGRKVLGWITRLPLFIYRILHTTILRPLYYPVAFVLAVLRPITLLLEIIYAVFLRTPLSILAWFIKEAIYPLYVFAGIAAILGTMFGYSASHIPRAAVYVTERLRIQISQSQSSGQPLPSLTIPTVAFPNGGGFGRRAGFASRSVTFDDADDGAGSDTTEIGPRGLGLRGVFART